MTAPVRPALGPSLGPSNLQPTRKPVRSSARGPLSSLRVQLAIVGTVAIYAPLLLVLGVDLVTDEEVIRTTGATVTSTGGGPGTWTVLVVLALAPVAAATAWWWAGRATRPVVALRSVAEEINETDLARRIDLQRGPTELVALAASFDAMLDRLEDALQLQSDLVEETSHEIRTPLAVIATTTDVLLARPDGLTPDHRAALIRAQAATRRLGETVDGLLAEARSRTRAVECHPLDLVALVRTVIDEARGAAPEGSAELVLDGPDEVVLSADRASVHRAVANLVDNALRHAPTGSAIEVAVRPDDAGTAVVSVTDHGPGLTAEAQVRAFDRFWRGDRAPGASGLGLAIARQVAEAHHGTLTLRSPGPGGDGCTFTLELPGVVRRPPTGAPPGRGRS